jgi:ribosomal protein L18E
MAAAALAAATVIASTIAAAGVTTALISGAVLVVRLVGGLAYVALRVAGFVCLEVIERLRAPLRHWTCISVTRVVAVVYVTVEASVAVVPGAGSDEDSSGEPVGAVVAVGSTGVWSVVKVPVWAYWGGSDADGDLSGCY